MKSKMYDKIKLYYDTGLWSEIRVRNMVINGIITETEYMNIIGKEYESQVILLFYLTVELRDLILKVRTYESQISQVIYV